MDGPSRSMLTEETLGQSQCLCRDRSLLWPQAGEPARSPEPYVGDAPECKLRIESLILATRTALPLSGQGRAGESPVPCDRKGVLLPRNPSGNGAGLQCADCSRAKLKDGRAESPRKDHRMGLTGTG